MGCIHTAEHRHTCSEACMFSPTVFSRNVEGSVCVHALPADAVLAPQVLHSCQSGQIEAVAKQVLYWEYIV